MIENDCNAELAHSLEWNHDCLHSMSPCGAHHDPLIVLQAKYKDALHPALVDPLMALAAVELRQSDTASWQRYLALPTRQSTTYHIASTTDSLVDSLACVLRHLMYSLSLRLPLRISGVEC